MITQFAENPNVVSNDARRNAAIAALGGNNFGGTMYQDPQSQMAEFKQRLDSVHDEVFLRQLALYATYHGSRDVGAYVMAYLLRQGSTEITQQVFDAVITDGTMLRKFVYLMRNGFTGSRSLGSRPKALINTWLAGRNSVDLVKDFIGQKPIGLVDVINLSHPRFCSAQQQDVVRYYMVNRKMRPVSEPMLGLWEFRNNLRTLDKVDSGLDWMLFRSNLEQMTAREQENLVTRMGDRAILKNIASMGHIKGYADRVKRLNPLNVNMDDMIRVLKMLPSPTSVYYCGDFAEQSKFRLSQEMKPAIHTLADRWYAHFSNEDTEPVTYVLDVSGSMLWSSDQSTVRPSDVAAFVASALARPIDKVVLFANQATVWSSKDGDTAGRFCKFLKEFTGGGTNLNAGMSMAAQMGSRNIVVISDGAANMTDYGARNAKENVYRMIDNGFKIAVWNVNSATQFNTKGVLDITGNKISEISRAFNWFNNVQPKERVDLVEAILSFTV